MATATGPFLSLDASGTIYDILTASIWKNRNYIRAFAIPSNPQTVLQVAHRDKFAVTVAAWQMLPAEAFDPESAPELGQNMWDLFGASCRPPLPGFNAYIKAYLADARAPDIPSAPFIKKKGIR